LIFVTTYYICKLLEFNAYLCKTFLLAEYVLYSRVTSRNRQRYSADKVERWWSRFHVHALLQPAAKKRGPVSLIPVERKNGLLLRSLWQGDSKENENSSHNLKTFACMHTCTCSAGHINLRTWRRMHLCIGRKFMGLAPADTARLSHLINTKK
jgi:hypothetical protein